MNNTNFKKSLGYVILFVIFFLRINTFSQQGHIKMTKTFIMLPNISISDKCYSYELQ